MMINTSLRSAEIILHCLNSVSPCGFFTAPGSRNAPFLQTLANMALPAHVHFDERALSFLALGACKGSGSIAVIITTSGTAVGNLLPAVMEADSTHTPLVIVSADRPYELQSKGANQTCKQEGIFGKYADFLHIPTLSEYVTEKTIVQRLLTALRQCLAQNKPLHINVELREPLYGDSDTVNTLPSGLNLTSMQRYAEHIIRTDAQDTQFLAELCAQNSVILAGDIKPNEVDALYSCAQKFSLPIIADIQSSLRGRQGVLSCYEPLGPEHDKLIDLLTNADNILIFGGRFISTLILKLLPQTPAQKFFCSPYSDDLNASGCECTYLFTNSISLKIFLTEEKNQPRINTNGSDQKKWVDILGSSPSSRFPKIETEVGAIALLNQATENTIFIGNSLIARYADAVLNTSKKIFTNRGISGIDGLIATAAGISIVNKATLAVIGDTSALYDISSLALLNKYPLRLVIFNNNGGRIFEKFPIKNKTAKENLFINPTQTSFCAVAQAFGIKSINVHSVKELCSILKEPPCHSKGIVIECSFTEDQGFTAFQKYINNLDDCTP